MLIELPSRGVRLNVTENGTGAPLILLHGGVHGSMIFDPLIPRLSQKWRTIAVDLQGHGETPDVDRPLRCETMADDIAALIDVMGLERPHLLGYSLGGAVALRVGIQHAAKIGALTLVSTAFASNGSYPAVRAAMKSMDPAVAAYMPQTPFGARYPNCDWTTLFTKLADLLKQDYDWSNELRALPEQTMLVYADADSTTPEHQLEFWKRLGGGVSDAGLDGSQRPKAKFAVIPGATHYDITTNPVFAEVLAFA